MKRERLLLMGLFRSGPGRELWTARRRTMAGLDLAAVAKPIGLSNAMGPSPLVTSPTNLASE